METRTIEQLVTTATELENDDLIPIWQDGKTKKISGTNFFKNRSSTPVDVVEDGNLHAVTSNAVYDYVESKATPVDVVENGNMHAVTSNAVADYVESKTLYNKDTKDLSVGWNNFYVFEGLKAGTYIITVSIDTVVNDINTIVAGAYTQIGVAGAKNGTLIMDIANDNTDMAITVYTNNAATGVTLRTVLMKVA